jgi:hypothetical protein
MIHALLRFCLSLSLVVGLAGSVRAAPGHLVAPPHLTDSAVIHAADSEVEGLNEVFRMDPPRLAFLAAGIVAGAVLIAPALGVNDILGVVLGIVSSEFLYHTVYEPKFGPSHWF